MSARLGVLRSFLFWLVTPVLSVAQPAPQPLDTGGPILPQQAAYDVRFYDLDLRIDPVEKTIRGALAVTATAIEPLDTLLLNLDPFLRVDSVTTLSADGDTVNAHFEQTGPFVAVALSARAQPGDRVWCRVYYGGHPGVAKNPPWDGGLVWAKTPSGANWIGVACQTEGADIWWPCKDHPSDEPDSMALHFTVPGDLVCVSNGRFVGETRNPDGTRTFHWFVSTPINNYGVSFYAAPYVTVKEPYVSVAGDTVWTTFWALPEDVGKAQFLMPYIHRDLRFLEEVAGPYPFRADKYGVAEAPYLGMEHQTIIAYGSDFRLNRYGFDWLHFHELAHEWYGNCATVSDWKDFWIHEGFATYMEALYAERLGGSGAYHEYMARLRPGIRNQMPLAPAESRTAGQMYNLDIYYKGAWVLHTLRYLMGEDNFLQFLRRVVYPDSTLERVTDGRQCHFTSSEELIALANSIAGEDLSWFFDVYLRQPQLPYLVVRRTEVALELHWEVPQGLSFPMPVEVKVGARRHRIPMSGGTGFVRISSGDTFEIDPDHWVLMDDPVITGVTDGGAEPPQAFRLHQNRPNPFNSSTVIEFSLPREERVQLEVFDVGGRRVAQVLDSHLPAGDHSVRFDATKLPAGTYLYRLKAGSRVGVRKMILLR